MERERQRREHREERLRQLAEQEADEERQRTRFRAKPVPRAVREVTAAGERQKEEQLYRAIKAQMRARELLHSSAMPPSMLARRLEERKQKVQKVLPYADAGASFLSELELAQQYRDLKRN